MFCKNCGKQNDDDAKFCTSCGFSMGKKVKEETLVLETDVQNKDGVVTETHEATVPMSVDSVELEKPKEKAIEIRNDIKERLSDIDVEAAKSKTKSFAEKEAKKHKNFKSLSLKQKIIRVVIPVALFLIAILVFSSSSSEVEDVKVKKSGENYVFDITYEEFCKEMAEVFSTVTGASEDAVITYCNEISYYDDTIEYYSGSLKEYEIGLETSEYSDALFVLKVNVYVEPETEQVVAVSVFKVNGSSTIDNFNILANKASLILSGKMLGDMEDYLVKTDDGEWEQVHYFEYEDCGMEFEQQKSVGFGLGGDLRNLIIYPAESFEILE